MRDYDIGRHGNKKDLREIQKEHTGVEGHRLPQNFGTIAKKLEQDKPSASDTLRSPVISSYNVGDMLMEGDLEGHYSQTGDDKKNYPQLGVQDYGAVQEDSTSKYVVKKEEDDYSTGSDAGIKKRKKD